MSEWSVSQLTTGSERRLYHSHSYYDIPVFNAAGSQIVAYKTNFQGRQPAPDDEIAIGVVDIRSGEGFCPLASSTAWSWQQGPLAQWVAGGPRIVFNRRGSDGFQAQIIDSATGDTAILPRTVYAVAPDGNTFFGLNMRRLEHLRPGYGYATGQALRIDDPAPSDDGVWRIDQMGEATLLLSIARIRDAYLQSASLFEKTRHRASGYLYWLNHLKLSPDGARFTVKLRWRRARGRWTDSQSVSVTGAVDGADVAVLGRGLSHVMWLNERSLYGWQNGRVILFQDNPGAGDPVVVSPGLIRQNVHLRHLPPVSSPRLDEAVFDTPYRETVELIHYRRGDGAGTARHQIIASFNNHVPATGPFRCDLHPCPSPAGDRIVVTSLADGGRQLYLVERV